MATCVDLPAAAGAERERAERGCPTGGARRWCYRLDRVASCSTDATSSTKSTDDDDGQHRHQLSPRVELAPPHPAATAGAALTFSHRAVAASAAAAGACAANVEPATRRYVGGNSPGDSRNGRYTGKRRPELR